ncbi:MAG TPA: alkyl sulfatase dimerization domain-containing protein [Mycobacterium sp.]|nr:alkyl sulfatase dimerization domain-containing protein [Mycobacterium sp.]
MGGIHRERPGAADLAAATGQAAIPLGSDLWMSPGVSNAYALATDEGRVLINAGLAFEGPLHRQSFAAIPGETQAIVITQGHPDHWGGVGSLRAPGSDIVMQRNFHYWRDDFERLLSFRTRNTSFAFAKFTTDAADSMANVDLSTIDMSFPEPTITFDTRLDLRIGGRDLVLAWTPGGETTDSLVVWLPDDRVLFTGNLFGPLFGHVPNLVTMRGDRYRDPILYIESLNTVLSFSPERLITGHFDPIEGDDRIAAEVTAMRDAMTWVHDRTVEGMEAGKDVHTLMREVRVPEHIDIGEGYGKTSWNVRAIWEMYAGWFHHRSTTELYDIPPSVIAGDLVEAAGAQKLVQAARARLAAGQPVEALHLVDVLFAAAKEDTAEARAIALEAHQALLHNSTNFWETAWLNSEIDSLRTAK